jgi:hypothetical protein
MIAKKLIAEVRKFKGPIFVEIQNFNDIFWIKTNKSDLIDMIKEGFDSDFETGFELDAQGYFGKDFGIE